MDFKGLGQVDKAFVPLLEKACSHHPSLVDDESMLPLVAEQKLFPLVLTLEIHKHTNSTVSIFP